MPKTKVLLLLYDKAELSSRLCLVNNYYSLLSAETGSFLAAFFAGIKPPINVRITLNAIRITALIAGNVAFTSAEPKRERRSALHGIKIKQDIPTPSVPDNNPTIPVSALNTCEILCFDAPMARRIPISFVRSKTEI